MKVMAHRGYSGAYPENTMLSFREAVKVGCDAIEMDVHETRDGRLVVIHDERLDRTTDGTGRICEHTFDELRQVNAAARFAGKYAPERIPSFDEYCEWASGESVGHNIEIKTDKIYYHDIERKIWATIERYGLEHKVMFSSFNHFLAAPHPRDQRQRGRSRRARARGQHRRLPRLLLRAGGLRLLPPAD